MTSAALLSGQGQKVSVISKTSLSPVTQNDVERFRPFDDPMLTIFRVFHVFTEIPGFAKRRVITAGFKHGNNR